MSIRVNQNSVLIIKKWITQGLSNKDIKVVFVEYVFRCLNPIVQSISSDLKRNILGSSYEKHVLDSPNSHNMWVESNNKLECGVIHL